MQLERIAFRGYKAFAGGESQQDDLQRLTLAPLTMIFGKNNSGKSAVVRLPRLLLGGLDTMELMRAAGNRAGVLPYTLVFDRKGELAGRELGGVKEARMLELVTPLL